MKKDVRDLLDIIDRCFDDLDAVAMYELEKTDEYIELRFDGVLYEIFNEYYNDLGNEILNQLYSMEGWDFYSPSVIRFGLVKIKNMGVV